MVALPTDVARSGVAARSAFETVFRAMVSVLERSLADKKPLRRERAQAIAALSIGGMIVARTLVDRSHADQLRASCLEAALQLGGWEDTTNGTNTRRSTGKIPVERPGNGRRRVARAAVAHS
jgi:hypothetical protein